MALLLADFNRMVDDHGPTLYRMAYRMIGDRQEAEDVVQETFRSAWKSRESFQPDGGGGRAWLAAILRRRVADHWRRPKPPTVLVSNPVEVECDEHEAFRDELSDEMQRALEQLPHELKETLLLVVVTELTHQEAANLLGIPLGTVLSRVSRARKRLRECLLAETK